MATTPDGFEAINETLAEAADLWEAEAPATYGYRVRLDCDCPDRGTNWVRVFDPDWPDDVPWDVDIIRTRIHDALATSPERVELAIDDRGLPVWFAAHGDTDVAILIEEFHEIERAVASPFDGDWRFIGGEIDGEEFGNPTAGLIIASMSNGFMSYPIDCNEASGPIDIHGQFFGIGPTFQTLAGCIDESDEGRLFNDAVQTATFIGMAGPELHLAGADGVVRFVPLEQPEQRGELPLTAAGETLVLDTNDGQLASAFTISPGSAEDWMNRGHPGRSVIYALTAVESGSGATPAWAPWEGEFDVPSVPPGGVVVVMPDDIAVGAYRLCSPYWADGFFCYDLLVRPASAPWYVTAGAEGVVLHDADGTSSNIWDQPSRIAFWFDELLLVESDHGTITTIPNSGTPLEWTGDDWRLLDAGRIGDSIVALVVHDDETLAVDVYRLDPVVLGPAVDAGRLAGSFAVLRPSPDRIEVVSSADGSLKWEMGVEPEEMISSVDGHRLRLDRGEVNTSGAPVPFWQYLKTRIVDIPTGDLLHEFEFEIAIPFEGDEVNEVCTRAELRDGLLLCPQPDGRLTTIGVEGGDMLAVAGATNVLATYVR